MIAPPDYSLRFSPSELEEQYSPSSCVADISPFIERYRSDTQRNYQILKKQSLLACAYGASPMQRLDLIVPAAGCPLLVFVHGGYWQELGREYGAFSSLSWFDRGWGWASIGYGLAPDYAVSNMVQDIRLALIWLSRHAAQFGFDPKRMLLLGHSAGAHLLAQAFCLDSSVPRVRGLVLMSGIYDLRPIIRTPVNDALGLTIEQALSLSPLFRQPALPMPVFLAWGENETAEFKRQSGDLARAWDNTGNYLAQVELPRRNHFDTLFDLSDFDSTLNRHLYSIFDL